MHHFILPKHKQHAVSLVFSFNNKFSEPLEFWVTFLIDTAMAKNFTNTDANIIPLCTHNLKILLFEQIAATTSFPLNLIISLFFSRNTALKAKEILRSFPLSDRKTLLARRAWHEDTWTFLIGSLFTWRQNKIEHLLWLASNYNVVVRDCAIGL